MEKLDHTILKVEKYRPMTLQVHEHAIWVFGHQ